jgi:uncharacterized protein YjaG (DUF416 family)
LRGETEPANLAGLRTACNVAAPDTEDFDSLLVSPALDAANVASLLLDLLITDAVEKAAEVACLACDTVDMYVQELDEMPPGAPDLEERITLHPLMQAEIARQLEDLETLSGGWQEGELRRRWHSPMRSNIDIG